jgi:hypothetical protein
MRTEDLHSHGGLRLLLGTSFMFAVLALFACGGGAASSYPAECGTPARLPPPPATVAEADAQLASAKADLERIYGSATAPMPSSSAKPPGPVPQAGTDPGAAPPPPSHAGAGASAGASACGEACRALNSMGRAVETICRLTSEGDAKCTEARTTLKESQSRVTERGCTCLR